MIDTQPVKGMRDFYPEELGRRSWLFAKFREAAGRFNFDEYDTCLLENEQLYTRKAGDEITNQLYCFEDKGGRRLALRPELTPSLARMIVARQGELAYPLRWFSIAQCFRYEKMQKGRKREHFQWNMDVIGDPTTNAELELLASLTDFFSSVGLTSQDVTVRFSNRKILHELLVKLGIAEERVPALCVIIDKLDKIGSAGVSSMMIEAGVDSSVARKLLSFTEATDLEGVERATGYLPSAAFDVQTLLDGAASYGIAPFLRFSPNLVRGLSYYTGTVFEAFETTGKGRAICGGGRYDHLIELFGGHPTPMVGFGFGDVVISLLLSEKGLAPVGSRGAKVLVAAFSQGERLPATRVAQELRRMNIRTELDLSFAKMKRLLSRADRQGFDYVAVAAPEELAVDKILVKDLIKQSDDRIPMQDIARVLMDRIRGT